MAKHRKEGPINDVLITNMYVGKDVVGTIVITEGQDAVLVFDEKTVGRSIKRLLEPNSLLAIRVPDEQTELPSLVDPDKFPKYPNPLQFRLF